MKSFFTPHRIVITTVLIIIIFFSFGKGELIIVLIFIIAAYYYGIPYSLKWILWLIGKIIGKNFVPSKKALKAVELIEIDEEFHKVLAKIIVEEGDFRDFIKRTEASEGYYNFEFENRLVIFHLL
jgi:hypothetical protein